MRWAWIIQSHKERWHQPIDHIPPKLRFSGRLIRMMMRPWFNYYFYKQKKRTVEAYQSQPNVGLHYLIFLVLFKRKKRNNKRNTSKFKRKKIQIIVWEIKYWSKDGITYNADELSKCESKFDVDFHAHVFDRPDQFVVAPEEIAN